MELQVRRNHFDSYFSFPPSLSANLLRCTLCVNTIDGFLVGKPDLERPSRMDLALFFEGNEREKFFVLTA